MITKIQLHNFQSHKDTTFEFCPTTNSIVGSSNNGKTVVLRAISWVVTNRPSADSLISHWAKDEKGNQTDDMSVTIEVDGHTITRLKTKKTNTYIVDSKVLEAVGRDVPEEVSSILNMNEVNIQKQMDAPFLLADSPGEVARFFNKLIKLDKIDVYLSKIESKKRKTRDTLQLAIENKEKTDKELATYAWTDKAEELLTTLKELTTTTSMLHKDIQTLKTQLTDKRNFDSTVTSMNEIIDNGIILIHKLEHTVKDKAAIETEASTLIDTTARYNMSIQNIDMYAPIITKAEAIINWLATYNPEQDDSDIRYLITTVREYKNQKSILDLDVDLEYAEKLVKRIIKTKERLTIEAPGILTLSEQIRSLQTICFNDSTKEIEELEASLPPFCPICGGPIHG